MRMSILLSSLFAASLLTTAALADRNSDDGDKAPTRSAKDRVVREARSQEAKETRAWVETKQVTPQKASTNKTAAGKLADKRGCSTDDGSSCARSSARSEKAAKAQTKAATQVKAPAFLQQKGCATEDGSSCSSSTKAAASKGEQASGDGRYMVGSKARNASVAEQILKLRREVDEKAFLDMMNIMTCKRSGSCGETPDGM